MTEKSELDQALFVIGMMMEAAMGVVCLLFGADSPAAAHCRKIQEQVKSIVVAETRRLSHPDAVATGGGAAEVIVSLRLVGEELQGGLVFDPAVAGSYCREAIMDYFNDQVNAMIDQNTPEGDIWRTIRDEAEAAEAAAALGGEND